MANTEEFREVELTRSDSINTSARTILSFTESALFDDNTLVTGMKNLHYERKVFHKNNLSRDFSVEDFQVYQYLREFFIHSIVQLLGSVLSLAVLGPWLGLSVCRQKGFFPDRGASKVYGEKSSVCNYRLLSVICISHFPLLVVLSYYLGGDPTGLLHRWGPDIIFVFSMIILDLNRVSVRHGYSDPAVYKNRYDASQTGDKSGVVKNGLQVSSIVLFCGLIGNKSYHLALMRKEIEIACEGLISMENDYISIPTQLITMDGKRFSVFQNFERLEHVEDFRRNVDHTPSSPHLANEDVKTTRIALAIGRAAVETGASRFATFLTSYFHIIFGVIYAASRVSMFVDSVLGGWEWALFFGLLANVICLTRMVLHVGVSLAVMLEKKKYFGERLSLLVHQMSLHTVKDVLAWRRLYFCMKDVASPQYTGAQMYSSLSVIYLLVCTIVLTMNLRGLCGPILLRVDAIPFVIFVLVAQSIVLYGIYMGSLVNKQNSRHCEEWLKAHTFLSGRLHGVLFRHDVLKQGLDRVTTLRRRYTNLPNRAAFSDSIGSSESLSGLSESLARRSQSAPLVMSDRSSRFNSTLESIDDQEIEAAEEGEEEEYKAKPSDGPGQTEDSEVLRATCATIIGLNEYLKLQRLYGGERFMSFRMNRLLVKALAVGFLYEISFFVSFFIGHNVIAYIESAASER
jgi:hypothetical protein